MLGESDSTAEIARRVGAIASRQIAITPGDWVAFVGKDELTIVASITPAGDGPDLYHVDLPDDDMERTQAVVDARFVASAPQDIRYLLGLADRVINEIRRLDVARDVANASVDYCYAPTKSNRAVWESAVADWERARGFTPMEVETRG